ncbi:MAG: DivIVA domain-containing protein [Solirubrobacteraceae bacterium]
MALDRQDIERKDFPIGRRGYEPEAVDAHLRRLSGEVEELRESSRDAARPAGAESLAVAASEQVRTIVEAAERSAADIQRQAEEEAVSIRDAAAGEAEGARSDAAKQAQDHVQNVSEATAVMLQRVDAMETELGALLESLRTGANRLQADLTLLEGNMSELQDASGAGAGRAAGSTATRNLLPPREEVSAVEEETDVVEESEAGLEEPEDFGDDAADEAETGETPAAAGADADAEGARLIALNMALNGSPREETDRYLADNFDIEDRAGLLDEVYSRVG